MKRSCLALLLMAVSASAHGATYYVSTTGSDTFPGTFDSAFATIPKATGLALPGDTIYVRGGTYPISTTISISRSGAAGNLCNLLAYTGERVFLDCTAMGFGSSNRGIKLNGSYWHIRGFDIYHAGDNGMIINGSYNVVEFCSFTENQDSGLQLASGASYNQIINCDSFNNVDPSQGNADGFAPKLDVGTGNYFYGCRSWQNSDDGWDGYMRPSNGVTTTLENCWSFMNGYLKDGTVSTGNGNGFKMGGSDATNLEHNMILENCLSFGNRVKGFDQNNNRGSMTLTNCTSFSNGTNNYSIPLTLDSGKTAVLTNCISAGTGGLSLGSFVIQNTDSWRSPFTTPSSGDFVSTDTSGVRAARKADGSLPDITFMHLATGSQFIASGTKAGLPYAGSAPDLGAFAFTPAPVAQLFAFSAIASGLSARLTWTTLSETGIAMFVVQRRSAADSIWSTFPNDSAAGQGPLSTFHQYALVDTGAGAGTWVYRVMQVNLDTTVRFSPELQVVLTPLVSVGPEQMAQRFSLLQNYPNPFNPSTTISYALPTGGAVRLEIFDLLGRRVTTLLNGYQGPGTHSVRFNASGLAAGTYFYRLRSGAGIETKKFVLLR